jgi:hypothetical protein
MAVLNTTNSVLMYPNFVKLLFRTQHSPLPHPRLDNRDNMNHHPHVHCVVTGGGLSCASTAKIDASPHGHTVRLPVFA